MNEAEPSVRASNIHRKPNIVHFQSDGPANQGSSSVKKRKGPAASIAQNTTESQIVTALENNNRPGQKKPTLRESHVTPPAKRQKTNAAAPAIRLAVQKAPQPNSISQMRTESVPLGGSQSSRVDENGSPLPFQHLRNAAVSIPSAQPITPTTPIHAGSYSDIEKAVEPFASEPVGQSATYIPTQKPIELSSGVKSSMVVSLNSKHRPSSPLAPQSIVESLTAHEVEPSGRLIDVHSARVIEPRKPQDPFVDAAQQRPNAFLERLQKATKAGESEQYGIGKHRDVYAELLNDDEDDDPEKTLIGDSVANDKKEPKTVCSTSSSSQKSSSISNESVDSGGEDAYLSWRKALDPYDKDIVKALERISVVSGVVSHFDLANSHTACNQPPW